jgi:hypothetical protein
MVHSVHTLDPRILPARHVDNVDHVTNDCPQCPQTVVYTVVDVHTVLCTMGVGRLVWAVRMVHKTLRGEGVGPSEWAEQKRRGCEQFFYFQNVVTLRPRINGGSQ